MEPTGPLAKLLRAVTDKQDPSAAVLRWCVEFAGSEDPLPRLWAETSSPKLARGLCLELGLSRIAGSFANPYLWTRSFYCTKCADLELRALPEQCADCCATIRQRALPTLTLEMVIDRLRPNLDCGQSDV